MDRPFQAPSLPANFVDRPQVTLDIKARLLANTFSDGTLLISAIHGLGGIGKTTLVTALAHDENIQKRFSGGVLWATLGQQPDILAWLSSWVQALGDYEFRAVNNVEATSAHLRSLLHDKAVLLVVDDAWEPDHVKPFLVASSQSQLLITSRRANVADAVGASLQQLNVMTPEESLVLLSQSLERKIDTVEKQEALRVAETVGYLPIALNLVAARVKRGITWVQLETALKQEVANLKVLYGPRQENTLEATFNLSLKALQDYDQKAWENFIWLGVLPEDVTVTALMAVTLWNMESQDEANERLELLWNDALLQSDSPVFVGGVEWKGYRLHDLLHDVARSRLIQSPPTGMGFSLLDAHSQLLERYSKKTQKNLWHTLPNDGYIYQHLVWHLEKAGQIEKIHQLLKEESATGNNGWFEVREKWGQTEGYVTDISRAWELAEGNWNESNLPQVVGLQCRYALMMASVNSLADILPVELLVALVKNNFWNPQQGLAYALQSPKPENKARSLTELANYLPLNLKEIALQKALEVAKAIQYEPNRTNALCALANKWPEILPEALAAARALSDKYACFHAFFALANKFPKVLAEARSVARSIQNELYQAFALCALADKMPEILPEALAVARNIQDEPHRTNVLCTLANSLPEILPEALAAVSSIQDEAHRAEALSILANKLPLEFLPEVLAVARNIQNESNRAFALCALADKLPPELLPEILTDAKAIPNQFYRVTALSTLTKKLPPELLPEVLTAAKAVPDILNRAILLSVLADKLPPDLLPEVLAAGRSIQDDAQRALTLRSFAYKIPDILPQALAAARDIQDEHERALRLRDLADKVPELWTEILAAARKIQDEFHRISFLATLSNKLPPDLLDEVLTAAKAIPDASNRASILANLANELPKVFPEALAAAKAIPDELNRASALSVLANKMSADLLPEVLIAARTIQDEYHRVSILTTLVDKLPEVFPEALATARKIADESHRVSALKNLANKQPNLFPEVLANAPATDQPYPIHALNVIADTLSNELKYIFALNALTNNLSSAVEIFPIWCNMIHELSLSTRFRLLQNMALLILVNFGADGKAAMKEVVCAIQDVARWWR
ncbi:hypothetical protein IQ244_13750 [Nostoc sp. LEGE 06077]|nr:hypothetical protein [Nostoc sp. LEGE 06077]